MLLSGLAIWGLVGCAARPAPAQFSNASTETAVIRWQRGSDAITGRAQLRRNPEGATRITLTSPDGPPLLQLTLETSGRLSASGSLIGRRWAGSLDRTPAELNIWIAFLRTWQQAAKLPPGIREIHSPAHRIAYEKTTQGLRSLSVASSDVRETIAATFVPNGSRTPTPPSSSG